MRQCRASIAHDPEVIAQVSLPEEGVYGRVHFALGEIPRRAEDDQSDIVELFGSLVQWDRLLLLLLWVTYTWRLRSR